MQYVKCIKNRLLLWFCQISPKYLITFLNSFLESKFYQCQFDFISDFLKSFIKLEEFQLFIWICEYKHLLSLEHYYPWKELILNNNQWEATPTGITFVTPQGPGLECNLTKIVLGKKSFGNGARVEHHWILEFLLMSRAQRMEKIFISITAPWMFSISFIPFNLCRCIWAL